MGGGAKEWDNGGGDVGVPTLEQGRSMNRLSFLWVLFLLFVPAIHAEGPKRPPQVERVRELYKAFAWEAIGFTDPGETLMEQARGVFAESFESELADLLDQEAACLRKRSVCRLLHHPLYTSRDPFVRGLEVVGTDTVSSVLARFTEGGSGSEHRTEIVFHLGGSGKKWKIADIFYPDGSSLREILATPME